MANLNLKDALEQSLVATKEYIDAELAKKANSLHGTHVTYGGNGSASTVSRSDHTHSYLPLSGGTMTGKITTPNNAQGITIGDDISLCDRNQANMLILEGSNATSGGIIFGSGLDTNIYRGGANLLKTDDTMNAVGGFQWNGQSLDNRYAPSSAQKNSDITKAEIEAKLIGEISTHKHENIDHLIDVNISSYTSINSNVLEPVRGMKIFSNIKKGTEGMFPSSADDNCILSINRGAGNGYVTHLGFGRDGLYYRKANGTLFNDTHQWSKIYTTENKPTLAELGGAPIVFTTQANYDSITPNANTLYIIS